jgi:preprotein translocase subunit SecA
MSWFKKNDKSKRLDDKVFINDNSKFKALTADIKKRSVENVPLFAVCFFDDTKEKLSRMLDDQQIKYRNIDKGFAGDLSISSEGEIHLMYAKTLSRVFNLKRTNQRSEKLEACFIFTEHYPVFSKEEAVIDKIDTLTENKAEILFYVSLDEALLQVFGSDNIKIMMQKMGLKESECIEHSFVTKSIINAQKKIEKKIGTESEASSQEDWFKKNYNR